MADPVRTMCPCTCESWGCEECRTRTQQLFADEVSEVFSEFEEQYLLTVIPSDFRVETEELDRENLKLRVKRDHRRLANSLPADCCFAGALDISLNTFDNGDPHWSLHYHGVLSRALLPSERRHLKRVFPRDPSTGVYFPIVQKAIVPAELRSTAEYCYKRFFTRRSSYIADPKSDRNPYLDAKGETLSDSENDQLQAALENYTVYDPIVLIGLKRKRSCHGADIRFMRTSRAVT